MKNRSLLKSRLFEKRLFINGKRAEYQPDDSAMTDIFVVFNLW